MTDTKTRLKRLQLADALRPYPAPEAAAVPRGGWLRAIREALGMTQGLNRLSPFLATLLDQMHRQYGLDMDASLRGLKVELMQQTGDTARLRLRYPLAGRDVDAVVPAVRIDGHWYLADFVRRAEASLAAGQPPGDGAKPRRP